MAVEIALSSWSSHLLVLMGTLLIGLGIFVLSGIIFAAKMLLKLKTAASMNRHILPYVASMCVVLAATAVLSYMV